MAEFTKRGDSREESDELSFPQILAEVDSQPEVTKGFPQPATDLPQSRSPPSSCFTHSEKESAAAENIVLATQKATQVGDPVSPSLHVPSKPRHIPAFHSIDDESVVELLSKYSTREDLILISQYYKYGIIGLVRIQKGDCQVESFISDICKRSTKLSISTEPSISPISPQILDTSNRISSMEKAALTVYGSQSASTPEDQMPLNSAVCSTEGSIGNFPFSSTLDYQKIDHLAKSGNLHIIKDRRAQSIGSNVVTSVSGPADINLYKTGYKLEEEDSDSSSSRNKRNEEKQVCFTASIGFTNRSKRWTLCPSPVCCSSADNRDKIVGQWKILRLSDSGDSLEVPQSIRDSYGAIMDDADYFLATMCPQQTYHAKHLPQGSNVVFNRDWHYTSRHEFPRDILLFVDDNLFIRMVWQMKPITSAEKYQKQAAYAESRLLCAMSQVLQGIRDSEGTKRGNTVSGRRTHLGSPARELCSRLC